MRKYHQKMILELLCTIAETANEARKHKSSNLLADCQDGAIEIGNLIERHEGADHVTVKYLEEYCELLYKASLALTEQVNESGVFKMLKKQHIKITDSVVNDINANKLEVVFFTYKASMWDSLESVWLTAKEDPDCETYVVPIPYYDRNSDGTLGQVYYEGGEYPAYVPITDPKSYDVSERRPEMIFIHNPYDNSNFVTSVHPDYYAESLRKFTDMLVYIPYFVCGDEVEEHFCVVPGTLYAHKTIVQSDQIRDEYLKYYKTFERENNCIGMFGRAEEKFVALGSPKIDAVINKKPTDFDIPIDWNICGKKVVLYNTTVAGLLHGDRRILDKLRFVFACFKDNKEVVLLWRPHPLSISTCKSMRPQLLDEYLNLVAEYRREGFGIYDDSVDLHRAMAVSDAYYGDWSSLVYMYGVTGKPIVIQNIDEKENKRNLYFTEIAFDEVGNAWGYERHSDGLYQLNFAQKTAKYISKSGLTPKRDGVELKEGFRYKIIFCADDLIICFPIMLDCIFVYNSKTGENKKILLDIDYLLPGVDNAFALYAAVRYQEKIYCFSERTKAIVVFDVVSHELSYNSMLFEKIGLMTGLSQPVIFPLFISECSKEGKVLLIMKDFGYLMRYSLITEEAEFLPSIPQLAECLAVTISNNIIWLLSAKNEALIKWNIDENDIIEYPIDKELFMLSDAPDFFKSIIDCEEYLLLLPFLGDLILIFSKVNGEFLKYNNLPLPDHSNNKNLKFARPRCIGNTIYIFANFNRTIYMLDKKTGAITAHKFLTDKEGEGFYLRDYFDFAESAVIERNFGNIADFFTESVSGENEIRKEKFVAYSNNNDGTAGKIIYERLKSEVLP